MNSYEITRDVVRKTYNTADNFGNQDALHAIIGLVGEVGELCDTIKRHQFYGQELDLLNLQEELGDTFFYFVALLECYPLLTLHQCVEHNRTKLKKRYPDGFTTQASIERADKPPLEGQQELPFTD